jgi:hypothetical protein
MIEPVVPLHPSAERDQSRRLHEPAGAQALTDAIDHAKRASAAARAAGATIPRQAEPLARIALQFGAIRRELEQLLAGLREDAP